MSDVLDYAKYYKNKSWLKEPFNAIDNLIFCSLSYIDWSNIVPTNIQESITIKEACIKYFDKYALDMSDTFQLANVLILKEISNGKRFKNIKLYNYCNEMTDCKQFGAICMKLPDSSVFVSFKGTTDELVGWKENFMLSYSFPVPAQKHAIEYLNNSIRWNDFKIRLGGHSKGGNLATCASMYCKKSIRMRITDIYNNDGPGFRKDQTLNKEYKDILPKLRTIIPEDSVIGMLLNCPKNYTVVKSENRGIMQHDLCSWKCFGTYLIEGHRSKYSIENEAKYTKFLEKYNDDQREYIVNILFELLNKSGITKKSELDNMNFNRFIKIIRELKNTNKDDKQILISVLKNLFIKDKENKVNFDVDKMNL